MMLPELRDRVAIAGIGYSPLTRHSRRTLTSLCVEACDNAIADAGLTRADIDGLATMPSMPAYGGTARDTDGIDVLTSVSLAYAMGIAQQIRWASDTKMMITQSVIDAVNAIAAGACKYALVWRGLHMPPGRYSDYSASEAKGFMQFMGPTGFTMPAAWAGAAMMRYFHLSGCTRESMGRFVVQNRENANKNRRAYFYKTPLTLEDYMGARMISDPCCLFDCDIPVDGAVAIVLTSRERARDLPNVPALITGYTSSRYRASGAMPWELEDLWIGGEATGRQLWATSGLGPRDMQAAQLYDGFSIFVYTWLEALGYAPRCEAFRLVDAGGTRLDGEIPVNTGGCSLAEGRVHGIAHITEAVLQVTGRGEERQVPGTVGHVAVTVNNGQWGTDAFVISRGA